MDKLKWLNIIVMVGLVLNVSLLYYLLFNLRDEVRLVLKNAPVQSEGVAKTNIESLNQTDVTTESASSSCSQNCLDKIAVLEKMIAQITPQVIREISTTTTTSASTNPSIEEYNIYLGSGTSKAWDWEDVPGANVDIDSTKYKNIKSVVFEATMRIPTAQGVVYARLFNKTDKHPVWFSEVSVNSDVSTTKHSGNITLDSGNKTYQVQMKTTMGVNTILDSSRIKIVVE